MRFVMDTEKLRVCGGQVVYTDGRLTVEFVNPNDHGYRRFQYRATDDGSIECRALDPGEKPLENAAPPWKTIQLVDPADPSNNDQPRFQYRVADNGELEWRVLNAKAAPYVNTEASWRVLSPEEMQALHAQRVQGQLHPVLDPLGL